jgi:hypothetical protein
MKVVLLVAIFLTAFAVGLSPSDSEPMKFSKDFAIKAISDIQASLNNLTEMYSRMDSGSIFPTFKIIISDEVFVNRGCENWCGVSFTSCSASCSFSCGPYYSASCTGCLNRCGSDNAYCLNRC